IDLQMAQQRARVAQSRANLTKAIRGPRTEEIARARAAAENAERERQRQQALLASGIAGQQAYDAAATAAKTAAETLREAERGSRPEDIDAARAQLEADERQLAYLQRQRQETTVVAPADGVIESMDLRPGDLVGANQPVAKMLEPSQLWVRVYVPEPELGRVHVGQEARLKVDTYPKREFPGKVVEIRTQSEYTPRNVQTLDQRMDQVFGVKVAIDRAPELRPGMASTVRLVENWCRTRRATTVSRSRGCRATSARGGPSTASRSGFLAVRSTGSSVPTAPASRRSSGSSAVSSRRRRDAPGSTAWTW